MPIETELLSNMHWLDSITRVTNLSSGNIPAFLVKLWKLVEDPKTDELISWSQNENSFIVKSQASFSQEILPLFFKHNNMASFIRQLNMYGFHKVVNIEAGGLRPDKDEMEFAHPYFLKGHEFLLEQIKRKTPCGKDEGKMKVEVLSKIVSEFKNMKMKQENLETKFLGMRKENETLWREIASLREKHMKQQQILNKLIHFLISLVQPNCTLGLKRPYSLMLNDANIEINSKMPKLAKPVARNKGAKDLQKSNVYEAIMESLEEPSLNLTELKDEEEAPLDTLLSNNAVEEAPGSPESLIFITDDWTNSDHTAPLNSNSDAKVDSTSISNSVLPVSCNLQFPNNTVSLVDPSPIIETVNPLQSENTSPVLTLSIVPNPNIVATNALTPITPSFTVSNLLGLTYPQDNKKIMLKLSKTVNDKEQQNSNDSTEAITDKSLEVDTTQIEQSGNSMDLYSLTGLLDQTNSMDVDGNSFLVMLENDQQKSASNTISKVSSKQNSNEHNEFTPSLFELIEDEVSIFEDAHDSSELSLFGPLEDLENSYHCENDSENLHLQLSKLPVKSHDLNTKSKITKKK